MDEFAVADVVPTEQDAELLCGLLRGADVACASRQTNFGAGAPDGMPTGGPYEVLVRAEDLDAAREVLGRNDDPHGVSGDG